MVQGTVNQEVPTTKKKEVPPLKHLLTVLGQCQRSLGTVPERSWDSAKEVLGQCSLGTVLGQCSPGIVLDQSSLGTVLGQYSLETVQSWDGTVLGQWPWDRGLGTVVLGQWSWDSGLGTVVLGQWSWDSGLGTVVLGQ